MLSFSFLKFLDSLQIPSTAAPVCADNKQCNDIKRKLETFCWENSALLRNVTKFILRLTFDIQSNRMMGLVEFGTIELWIWLDLAAFDLI